jgi:DNA-binding transcriptional ArsR family regulator
MRDFMQVVKALGDENRVRILLAVQHGELCVCQITALMKLAPSTVSKHISILHQARLLDSRKSGRWIYYRQAGQDAPDRVRSTLDWLTATASNTKVIKEDARNLKQILKQNPEELCKQMTRN